MKFLPTALSLGTIFLLGSCSLPSAPGFYIGTIDFRTAAYTSELKGVKTVAIISDYVPSELSGQVKRVHFLVGNSTLEGTAKGEQLGTVYFWETSNSCRDLPQGDNISVSYEMLGADNAVLKKASLVVPKIQTCS
ncbi:hypothetical protein E5F05_02075 (plasmid) [Deinococcus metallilatus]|uniref:DUF3221 domain-containing protein n=1 Tax=Deinococcus metallilatus TaxID=1211322 RepID=A0ABR6MV60_9DEIO|nr:hypothetical protein [Deinococcus metallilatus]MBB5295816.1 hypothetical protein [Deinococcus metallilatus]QBY06755.1 hypothetical protein E5F05_02075 [Deinococcus metallilatus]GMA14344.1 hypothetical protein GCM10025871_06750 [Deinococcus metallilatus]